MAASLPAMVCIPCRMTWLDENKKVMLIRAIRQTDGNLTLGSFHESFRRRITHE